MDTLNRALLIVLSGLIALASLVGVLLAFRVISPAQLRAVIPYQRLIALFQANFVAAALVSILLLIVVFALAALWLRGQLSASVTAIVGGEYEVEEKGPGTTVVDYSVVEHSIDNLIKHMPGVLETNTQIFSQENGELFAHSSLTVRRNTNLQDLDRRIEKAINREWINKLGINLARHDMTIHIAQVEQWVA
ncbi:MAG TPA: hypothetical protein VGK02_07925 [Candidatus Aquicultor sp.]|jgi:hypothetical protein